MSDDPTPIPGTAEANDLVVRGADGDPVNDPRAVRMIEVESYERVVEGLKIASDACRHLAARERMTADTWATAGVSDRQHKALGGAAAWNEVCGLLDIVRRNAVNLARIDHPGALNATPPLGAAPLPWKEARERFLAGIRQATGGMRQLAVCFRADLHWTQLAQELERRERSFRALLVGRSVIEMPRPRRLVLPPRMGMH